MTATLLETAIERELSRIGIALGKREYQKDYMAVIARRNSDDLLVGFSKKPHPYNRIDDEENASLDPEACAVFMRRTDLNEMILITYGIVLRDQPEFLHDEERYIVAPKPGEVDHEKVCIDDLRFGGLTRTAILCVPADETFQKYEIDEVFALREYGVKERAIEAFFGEYDHFQAQGSLGSSGNPILPAAAIARSVRNYLRPEE